MCWVVDLGVANIRAGGDIRSGQDIVTSGIVRPLHTILAVGDGSISARAAGQVDIQAILNPHLVVQSSGTGNNVANINAASWTLFSTYAEDSAVSLQSLTSDVRFLNGTGAASDNAAALSAAYRTPLNFGIAAAKYNSSVLSVLPPSLSVVSMLGSASVSSGSDIVLGPGRSSELELLAGQDIRVESRIYMADTIALPDPMRPVDDNGLFASASSASSSLAHAPVPVHQGDRKPVQFIAASGSITGTTNRLALRSPKAVNIQAAGDVRDFSIEIQHSDVTDVSRIEAGGDISFSSQENRSASAFVAISGPGRLDMTAGNAIDLGTSAGVLSRGTLDNPNLPSGGADLNLAAGVGAAGLDYAGAANRLVSAVSETGFSEETLWMARWLTGDTTLTRDAALNQVQQVAAADPETLRTRVREMLFIALLQTGRDSNNQTSPFAGSYARGYQALEIVFPGMGNSMVTGAYAGKIDIFASRIKTEQGGDIELLVPGGPLVVGLSNTPEKLTKAESGKDSGPLGVITVGAGDIRVAARDDVLVNQSRILTAAGGDVVLWSSEGDIDAGKGKKTATAVPPPVIKVDSAGNVTLELQAAASGSGIGALSTGDIPAGDVDLIAPKGTVNAGDAGIRAGNLNIAALVVLGADNISVSGSSAGTPVADTGAVTAASSGATSGGDDTGKVVDSLNQAAAESAKAAQELAAALKPSVVRVEVLGYGE